MTNAKMGKETRQLTDDIIDLATLIIVAAIMIVLVFMVIESLIGEVPAYIALVIIDLGGIFSYATNKSVGDHINNWLKEKR
jgi:hypothetical protein